MKKKAAALKYFKEDLDTPVISALGAGDLAQKIIAEAKINGIEIVQSDEFFQYQDLFALDHEIPEEVYKIVVEILTFMIQSNKGVKDA